MSKHALLATALASSLVLGLGMGADAQQQNYTVSSPRVVDTHTLAPGRYTFATALSPRYFGGGAYVGILNLRVSPDGTIGGFFRYEGESQIATVVGGVTKGNLWLDYGPGLGANHIFGRIENGKIVGSTYFAGQPYDFVASQRTPGV
jgi:hypothetical protein